MGVTAKELHALLPEVPLITDVAKLNLHMDVAWTTIFDPGDWLRRLEPDVPGARLACGWETTSDSIAARFAVALGAAELVLLKSTLPVSGLPAAPGDLAAAGYVDGFFPQLAAELPPTRIVGFRDDSFQEVQLAGFRQSATA